MKSKLDNNVLYLYFEGELNSSNADSTEKEIEAIIAKNSFEKLVLDFSDLRYVSSAGLRVILKLKQKYNNVQIVEVSLEVYDVLSMTGFVNIIDVKKALKKVDISNAEVIGTGFFSTVYRIDQDTIIKVFNRTSDTEQIERELKLAKQAFVLGIPTAISYDIVKAGDKLGVRFEMLDCMSLKNAFLNYPDRYDELVDKYVALLKKINTTESFDSSIRDIKKFYIDKLDVIKEELGDKYYEKAKKALQSIEERTTFVHGDCHFKNIMMEGDELILIDMDTLARGHPIFELALIRAPYVAFEEDDPGNSERFMGVKSEFLHRVYNDILDRYLKVSNEDAKNKIAAVCYIHMVWWNKVNTPDNMNRLNGCRSRLCALLDKYEDLNIE